MTHNFILVEVERYNESFNATALINRPYVAGREEIVKIYVLNSMSVQEMQGLATQRADEYEQMLVEG